MGARGRRKSGYDFLPYVRTIFESFTADVFRSIFRRCWLHASTVIVSARPVRGASSPRNDAVVPLRNGGFCTED